MLPGEVVPPLIGCCDCARGARFSSSQAFAIHDELQILFEGVSRRARADSRRAVATAIGSLSAATCQGRFVGTIATLVPSTACSTSRKSEGPPVGPPLPMMPRGSPSGSRPRDRRRRCPRPRRRRRPSRRRPRGRGPCAPHVAGCRRAQRRKASEPHTPHALTAIRTSAGPTSGTGSLRISTDPGPVAGVARVTVY